VVSKPISAHKQAQRPAAANSAPQAQADLAAARQLADAGKLADAAAICQAHLDRQGPSAQAFYLLGLVRDSGGDPQAVDYYRKALYLEPDHYETLLQMSLLLEKNGDRAGARTFKQRAERVQQKP
jgi:chemotaxis protein methyltransferase WspC